MADDTRKILYGVVGMAFTVCAGCNAFFIRRLVDQLDETRKVTLEVQRDIIKLKARLGIDQSRNELYGPSQVSVKFENRGPL